MRSGSRTKWFTENWIFYISVSNSARRPCGGILFVCFHWSLHWVRPKALTGGPRGRLSSPPNHKMERWSSLCALNYTPQLPFLHTGLQLCPSHPKNKTEAKKRRFQWNSPGGWLCERWLLQEQLTGCTGLVPCGLSGLTLQPHGYYSFSGDGPFLLCPVCP